MSLVEWMFYNVEPDIEQKSSENILSFSQPVFAENHYHKLCSRVQFLPKQYSATK